MKSNVNCRNCGGNLYELKDGRLVCAYCDTPAPEGVEASVEKKPYPERVKLPEGKIEYRPKKKEEDKTFFLVIGIIVVLVIVFFVIFPGVSNNNKEESYVTEDAVEEQTPVEEVALNIDPISKKERVVDNAAIVKKKGRIKSEEQVDSYSFTPERKGTYRLEFSGILNEKSLEINVYNDKKELIDYSYSCENGEGLTLSDLKPKHKYIIKILGYSYKGPYTLSIGHQKQTINISKATVIKDSHEFTDQDNKYKIVIPYDGTYRFEMAEMMNDNSVEMKVYNRLGETSSYDYSCNNGNGLTLTDLKQGDVYYLHVIHTDSFGQYELKVGKQKKVQDISEYDVVNDSIEFTDQDNTYTYIPNGKDSLDVHFSEMVNDEKVEFKVYNRLGECIYNDYNCGNGDSQYISDLKEGETYTIHVMYCSGYTPYSMHIQ